jgi:hypothetical protein
MTKKNDGSAPCGFTQSQFLSDLCPGDLSNWGFSSKWGAMCQFSLENDDETSHVEKVFPPFFGQKNSSLYCLD